MRRAFGRDPRLRRGASSLGDQPLHRNLSFVLHEHSESETVRAAAAACSTHLRALPRTMTRLNGSLGASPESSITGFEDFLKEPAETLLTVTLGVPRLLGLVARLHPDRPDVRFADRSVSDGENVEFFRAPACLALPSAAVERLFVAAVVLRPGRRSAELRWSGPFQWPQDREPVTRALERLIQPFATQWMPPEALWPAPAERLLADEIITPE